MAGCSSRNASLRCVSCTSRTTRGTISPCSSPPCRGCRSPPSGCCAGASGRTSSCRNSSRPSAWPAASSTCSMTGGSGCLKDLDLVARIIRAVRSATHLPVTVKIRSGWDEAQRDPVTIAQRCREAGAQALTLHARTRTQMFSGAANWDEIARVVEALDIPVIGNGDITAAEHVVAMRAHTNCAGVMIARGVLGNPWIFAQARDLAAGRAPSPAPTAGERFAVALEHARLALALQGDTRKTALEFRKHFGWYTKGVPGAGSLRERLFQIESMREAEAIFATYLAGSAVEQAA